MTSGAGQDNRPRLIVALAAALFLAPAIAPPATAEEQSRRVETYGFEVAVEQATILPDSSRVLLIANQARRAFVFDVDAASMQLEFDLPYVVADAAVDAGARYAFFAGADPAADGTGVLVRLDLASGALATIALYEPLDRPSISVDGAGRVFVADRSSGIVMGFEGEFFEKAAGGLRLDRKEFPQNVYLPSGAVGHLDAIPNENVIFVAVPDQQVLLAVDTLNGEALDAFSLLRGKGSQTLPAQTVVARADGSRVIAASILLGFDSEEALMVVDYDADFRKLYFVGTASFSLRIDEHIKGIETERLADNPLLIASDAEQNTIIFGSRYSKQLAFLRRDGHVLERGDVIEMETQPIDIDVSPDGRYAVVVNADGTFAVLRQPEAGAETPAALQGSETMREVQRALSALGFPVGVVDGMPGPRTRRALTVFQKTMGLHPTGIIDEPTLQRLRELADSGK